MTAYTFTVPGKPQGQGRPRFARMGKFVRTYDPDESRDWKSKVAIFAQQSGVRLIEGAVSIDVLAYLLRPQRLMRKRDPDTAIVATCRPDVDNIGKAVQDALTGIAYADDAAVAECRVRKFYHSKGSAPRTVVTVREWQGDGPDCAVHGLSGTRELPPAERQPTA